MTIKITYDEIRREVGRFLGFDRDPTNWDTDEAQDIADIIRRAERTVYFQEYIWSFLVPSSSIVIPASTSTVDMPDDFIRMESSFTNNDMSGGILQMATDAHIRAADTGDSGRIEYYTIRIKTNGSYEAQFFPTPTAATTLSYRYLVEPQPLSDSNQYHLGTAMHSEMFLEAVLSQAELTMNPETLGDTGGLHNQKFEQIRERMIEMDKTLQVGG